MSKPVNRMLRLNLSLLLREVGERLLGFFLHLSWNMVAVAVQVCVSTSSFNAEAGMGLLGRLLPAQGATWCLGGSG